MHTDNSSYILEGLFKKNQESIEEQGFEDFLNTLIVSVANYCSKVEIYYKEKEKRKELASKIESLKDSNEDVKNNLKSLFKVSNEEGEEKSAYIESVEAFFEKIDSNLINKINKFKINLISFADFCNPKTKNCDKKKYTVTICDVVDKITKIQIESLNNEANIQDTVSELPKIEENIGLIINYILSITNQNTTLGRDTELDVEYSKLIKEWIDNQNNKDEILSQYWSIYGNEQLTELKGLLDGLDQNIGDSLNENLNKLLDGLDQSEEEPQNVKEKEGKGYQETTLPIIEQERTEPELEKEEEVNEIDRINENIQKSTLKQFAEFYEIEIINITKAAKAALKTFMKGLNDYNQEYLEQNYESIKEQLNEIIKI